MCDLALGLGIAPGVATAVGQATATAKRFIFDLDGAKVHHASPQSEGGKAKPFISIADGKHRAGSAKSALDPAPLDTLGDLRKLAPQGTGETR